MAPRAPIAQADLKNDSEQLTHLPQQGRIEHRLTKNKRSYVLAGGGKLATNRKEMVNSSNW